MPLGHRRLRLPFHRGRRHRPLRPLFWFLPFCAQSPCSEASGRLGDDVLNRVERSFYLVEADSEFSSPPPVGIYGVSHASDSPGVPACVVDECVDVASRLPDQCCDAAMALTVPAGERDPSQQPVIFAHQPRQHSDGHRPPVVGIGESRYAHDHAGHESASISPTISRGRFWKADFFRSSTKSFRCHASRVRPYAASSVSCTTAFPRSLPRCSMSNCRWFRRGSAWVGVGMRPLRLRVPRVLAGAWSGRCIDDGFRSAGSVPRWFRIDLEPSDGPCWGRGFSLTACARALILHLRLPAVGPGQRAAQLRWPSDHPAHGVLLVDVDDLDRIGETLVGEGSDPGRAVAEDDPAVGIGETAAFGFAAHALGEGGGFAVGIATGGRLDGGRVGD